MARRSPRATRLLHPLEELSSRPRFELHRGAAYSLDINGTLRYAKNDPAVLKRFKSAFHPLAFATRTKYALSSLDKFKPRSKS